MARNVMHQKPFGFNRKNVLRVWESLLIPRRGEIEVESDKFQVGLANGTSVRTIGKHQPSGASVDAS